MKLAWIDEPTYVADLRNERYGYEKGNPTHRLIGYNDWYHRPTRHDRCELLVEVAQAPDGVDGILEHDLLRRMVGLPGRLMSSVTLR